MKKDLFVTQVTETDNLSRKPGTMWLMFPTQAEKCLKLLLGSHLVIHPFHRDSFVMNLGSCLNQNVHQQGCWETESPDPSAFSCVHRLTRPRV